MSVLLTDNERFDELICSIKTSTYEQRTEETLQLNGCLFDVSMIIA